MVKVKNMESSSGKGVLHQFIIYTNDGIYFQSYDSIIVKMTPEKTYLDRKRWDFSTTTGKYRNIFLGEKKDETERKIKSGIYILEDLN